MRPVLFVDTSAWMAMADDGDMHHAVVRTARDRWLRDGGVMVSSDYVLVFSSRLRGGT